jgi:HEPN domain-containing protein
VSTPAVTRADFQQLAEVRIKEAEALLNLGLWDGAYYLTGYAVEVALKACIIKALMARDAFPGNKVEYWTHDFGKLLELADLRAALSAATAADATLLVNWGTAKDWKEDRRYHRITEIEAKDLYAAVSDATHGVLTWIKTQW